MAKAWEITDEFWSRMEPLIPVQQRVADQSYARKSGDGQKPKDPRLVFEAIVYVLRIGY
jgi:transposase